MAGTKNVSVYLCYILRHCPEEIPNLEMDKHGWVDTGKLIEGINRTGKYTIDMESLEEIVRTDNKGRYEFSSDKSRIKCRQGHSVNVIPELEYREPPKFLYHGTHSKNYEKIMESGYVSKMSRHHVHLQEKEEKAWQSAERWHQTPVLLKIDAEKMGKEGYSFGVTANGVWCVDEIPTRYICEVIQKK